MAHDEDLAGRIRGLLGKRKDVSEKRMFGGIAFVVGGHMSVGIVGDDLMVRVGPDAHAGALREPHVREVDFAGRPLKGFVYVALAGLGSARDLERWVRCGTAFAESLPSKGLGKVSKPPDTARQRPVSRVTARAKSGTGRATRSRR